MKTIEIVNTVHGLKLKLSEDGEHRTEVRAYSYGFFEGTSGFPEYGIPYPRYPEELLLGQTELENKLKFIGETSAALWHYDGDDWIYDGFPNDGGLDDFLSTANEAFNELRELLRGKYEVIVDCHMEREYWISGKERKTEQKKRVKLMLDYGTWCLWLYDEYDCYICPTEINELVNNQTELAEMISKLEDDHRGLFINNEYEFSYKGFDNIQQARDFVKLLNNVWSGLNKVLGGEYKLELAESLDINDWYCDSYKEEGE